MLAEAGQDEAFELAEYLLYVVDPCELNEEEKSRVRNRSATDWVFPRFGYHNQDELCTRIVAALETFDARRTLGFLLAKIQRTERLADDLDLGGLWRFMRLETERQPNPDDVVAMLIVNTAGLARRLAAKGSKDAEWVMEAIESHG